MSTTPLFGARAARLARLCLIALLVSGSLSSCALFRARPPVYDPVTLPSGVVVEDLVVPDEAGPRARQGDRVEIHYELFLEDGERVDSSYERGQVVEATLGAGELPAGLDEGIRGMRLYGKRRVVVPPEEGYGSQGRPPRIPPDARLEFVLELMKLHLEP